MVAARSALVAVLFLAGCRGSGGSSSQSAGSQQPPPRSPTPVAGDAAAPATPSAGGYDITKPCSMITAAEVSAIVGFPVTSTDEGFRCKFADAKNGWLSVKLLEASSRSAGEICDYAKDKRTVVPGVGDSTSYLGSTVCTKLGDVAIIVDGASVAEHSPELGKSGAENAFVRIAKTVASRIP